MTTINLTKFPNSQYLIPNTFEKHEKNNQPAKTRTAQKKKKIRDTEDVKLTLFEFSKKKMYSTDANIPF